MNYEVVVGDVEYEWSLGVFPSLEAAKQKAVESTRLWLVAGYADDEHEFSYYETPGPPRGPLGSLDDGYDDWLIMLEEMKRKQASVLPTP